MTTIKQTLAGIAAAGSLAGGGSIVVDNQINPYETVGTTLQIQDMGILPEAGRQRVVLDTTKPKMTLEKWNGEVAMGITYNGMTANTAGTRPFLSKNVEWSDGNQTMQVMPLEASPMMEDGGYEINIILNSPPPSNVFSFSVAGADKLDFLYQTPIKKPGWICTETKCIDSNGEPVLSWQENVAGSYAVYYKGHKNHRIGSTNYATGKAYHIYRPLITDATGATVWAELFYSEGVLTVTVPQTFLNSATYPVTVDPIIGQTSCGAFAGMTIAQVSGSISRRNGITATMTETGSLSKISICLIMNNTNRNVDASVFLNTENTVTDSLNQIAMVERLAFAVTTTGTFYDFTAANESLSAINYALNVVGKPDSTAFNNTIIMNDNGGSGSQYSEDFASYPASKESPWTVADAAQTQIPGFYLTYTTGSKPTGVLINNGSIKIKNGRINVN